MTRQRAEMTRQTLRVYDEADAEIFVLSAIITKTPQAEKCAVRVVKEPSDPVWKMNLRRWLADGIREDYGQYGSFVTVQSRSTYLDALARLVRKRKLKVSLLSVMVPKGGRR